MIEIRNCHTHVFTIDHVPVDFMPFKLGRLLRYRPLRRVLGLVLRRILPGRHADQLDRYVNFISFTYKRSQAQTFRHLLGYYPKETRFVVLSMDMAYMGAGAVPAPFEHQLDELAALKAEHGDRILPFVAADPRRPGVAELVRHYVDERGFCGVKLYPPLGYWPFDERLDPVYAFAEERGLPVLTHCSRGGVYYRGRLGDADRVHPRTGERLRRAPNAEFTDHYTDPDNYRYVLESHPRLKLCLAHMGGGRDWEEYLCDPWHGHGESRENWLEKTLALLRDERWSNVFADVSYTLHEPRFVPLLKLFLIEERLRPRILFGSDFYMQEMEISEREFSIRFRFALGEADYRRIAVENPAVFLRPAGPGENPA